MSDVEVLEQLAASRALTDRERRALLEAIEALREKRAKEASTG